MDRYIPKTPFDSNGTPCDFIDEDGTLWIYQGKKYGFDDWIGSPIDG